MGWPAVFSLSLAWRSLLPKRYKRRPETDSEQSPDLVSPVPPSSAVYSANAEKNFTTHSKSSFRPDRDHRPSPSPPDHHRQPHNHNHIRIRSLPLISSIFVPFSILLAIPGLTDHWYIRTNARYKTIEFQPNPTYLKIMLGFSMAFAVISNLCLLVRLFERIVKWMTIVCIISLTLHNILDITVIIIFVIKTQVNDGFSLGQAFWTTVCSTIAAFIANTTLILDYWKTPGAERDVSGLTKKQRALAIMMIGLLCYIAFGAGVHTALLTLPYIDALYFTVVVIETIGFGDITPQSTGARIFTSLYTIAGIVIFAINIGLIHESLSEAIRDNFDARIRRKWKDRIKHRWKAALKWRLEHAGLPVWVPVDEEEERIEEEEEEEEEDSAAKERNGGLGYFLWRSLHAIRSHTLKGLHNLKRRRSDDGRNLKLNLRALTEAQLQGAAMEAGAPLKDLLPGQFHTRTHHELYGYVRGEQAATTAPTQYRMGMMITLLGNFAYAFSMGQQESSRRMEEGDVGLLENVESESSGGDFTMDELQLEEKKYFLVRIIAALALFFSFWLIGSVIFAATEDWSYSLSLYFCFVTFSTLGYGDLVPKSPAGRSIFVGWALCGVGTMTILISLLAERYTEGYKDVISRAAQSTVPEDVPPWGKKNPTSMTAAPSTSPINRNSEAALTGPPPPLTGDNQRHDNAVFGNQELLSRVDTLKELIVDEEVFKEGKLLHTFESELQNILSHIRRSKKSSFTEGTEQREFMD